MIGGFWQLMFGVLLVEVILNEWTELTPHESLPRGSIGVIACLLIIYNLNKLLYYNGPFNLIKFRGVLDLSLESLEDVGFSLSCGLIVFCQHSLDTLAKIPAEVFLCNQLGTGNLIFQFAIRLFEFLFATDQLSWLWLSTGRLLWFSLFLLDLIWAWSV